MGSYSYVKLGDISEVITKGTTAKKFLNDGVAFIKIESINSRTTLGNKLSYISEEEHKTYLKRSILKEGDILFSIAGALGIVHIVQKEELPANTNQALSIIRLKQKEKIEYVSWFLETPSIKKMILELKSIGAQPNLSLEQISNIKIPMLSSNKLEHIVVELLNTIEKRIETQNKIIEELNSLRKTIINTLIEHAYARGNIVAVEKCVKDYNDKTIHDAEYPVLSSTAGGIFFQNDYFKKEAASEDTTGYKKVPYGYCTYRSMSDTGRFFFNIQDITDVGIVSPAYPVFSVKDNSALFLITILNNDEKVINSILKQKAGGTRFSLPFNKLCKIKIPWPEKNERSQLIDFISLLNNKVDIEKKILSKYLEQKNYLLSNLFI